MEQMKQNQSKYSGGTEQVRTALRPPVYTQAVKGQTGFWTPTQVRLTTKGLQYVLTGHTLAQRIRQDDPKSGVARLLLSHRKTPPHTSCPHLSQGSWWTSLFIVSHVSQPTISLLLFTNTLHAFQNPKKHE